MVSHYPKLDILLLAAGQSLRMGAENKLLMPYGRSSLVRHITEQLIAADIGPVTIVTGFDAERVSNEIRGLAVALCHNIDYEQGQMSSVRAGSRVLTGAHAGMMVALCDMPFLTADDYRRLHQQFCAQNSSKILIPEFAGERGNPIIIPRILIADIANGALNAGCKKLVRDHPELVETTEVASVAYISDIDTPGDYQRTLDRSLAFRAPCC